MQITQKPTKNFDKGRYNYRPVGIVIHSSDLTQEQIIEKYTDKKTNESAHYLVCKNGDIIQFVDESDTAKTNGAVDKPNWKYIKQGINPNLYTITIQHEGKEWTDEMYWSDTTLIRGISKRWDIPIDENHVIGHDKIDSINNADNPGDGFSVEKLFKFIKKYEVKMKELQSKLEQKDKEIDELRKELDNKEKSLNQESEKNSKLASTLEDTQKKLEELEKKVDKSNSMKNDNPGSFVNKIKNIFDRNN